MSIRDLNIAINGKPIVRRCRSGHRRRRTRRPGRLVRFRQIDDRQGHDGAAARYRAWIERFSRGLGGTQLIGASDDTAGRRSARTLCGHGVPESVRRAESGDDGGAAGRSSAVSALRSVACTNAWNASQAMLDKVGLGEDVLLKYPHRTVGRATAARRHRHGAGHLAAADHRRRTDHRIGFDHATSDRGPAHVAGGRCRARPCCSSPMISRCCARATTRCYVLDGGSIAETGTTASLLQAPASEPARRLVDAARLLTLPHGNSAGSSVGSRESARAQSKRETFKNTAIMRKDDGNE